MHLSKRWPRRSLTLLVLIGSVVFQAGGARAGDAGWAPRAQVTQLSVTQHFPALAASQTATYILSTGLDQNDQPVGIYFTTNETGSWVTKLVPNALPLEAGAGSYPTALAFDSSTKTLFAAWIAAASPGHQVVEIRTRGVQGAWSSPTDIATNDASLTGAPSIVAGGGKAYVAFSARMTGACDDGNALRTDILVASYQGGAWAAPQNLTSCMQLPNGWDFWTPKLALDNGVVYLVSANYSELNWDLWYTRNIGTGWPTPTRLTTGRTDDTYAYDYAIAASGGTVFLAYVQSFKPKSTGHHDVMLVTHAAGKGWHTTQVTTDAKNCDKHTLSLAAVEQSVALAYELDGSKCGDSADNTHEIPYVMTGLPGNWTTTQLLPAGQETCDGGTVLAPATASFPLVVSCAPASTSIDNLFYTHQGSVSLAPPVATLTVSYTGGATSIPLSWSAQGASVVSYEVQIRVDHALWHPFAMSKSASHALCTPVHSGHLYTFRVRALNASNMWSTWVMASVSAT